MIPVVTEIEVMAELLMVINGSKACGNIQSRTLKKMELEEEILENRKICR